MKVSLKMAQLPLAGIRVLELAEGHAGPMSGMWLADLGAEVIKIEAIQRYDHARGPVVAPEGLSSYPKARPLSRPYDVMSAYVIANRNKLAATVDLSRPQGVELFKRLVALSDVVVTNMVTGVPEKLGIGYKDLSAVRTDLIVLMSSGYGASGPYARRVTMGGAMDGIAGQTWLRHYPDQSPDTANYSSHTDTIAGINTALAVLLAIYHRAQTGQGQLVEISSVEANLHQINYALMDYAMNGRVQGSTGNDHPSMAPHGCYPCKGEDRWIAIAVSSQGQWEALCRVMGAPSWAQDPGFATATRRWAHREDLNERLGQWTRQQEHIELMHRLQRAGVPAGAVHDARERAADPHWEARGAFQQAPLGNAGSYPIPTSPWFFQGVRAGVRRPPPRFAEHNGYVFRELLALPQEEVQRLRDEEYIGDTPLMTSDSGSMGRSQARRKPESAPCPSSL